MRRLWEWLCDMVGYFEADARDLPRARALFITSFVVLPVIALAGVYLYVSSHVNVVSRLGATVAVLGVVAIFVIFLLLSKYARDYRSGSSLLTSVPTIAAIMLVNSGYDFELVFGVWLLYNGILTAATWSHLKKGKTMIAHSTQAIR